MIRCDVSCLGKNCLVDKKAYHYKNIQACVLTSTMAQKTLTFFANQVNEGVFGGQKSETSKTQSSKDQPFFDQTLEELAVFLGTPGLISSMSFVTNYVGDLTTHEYLDDPSTPDFKKIFLLVLAADAGDSCSTVTLLYLVHSLLLMKERRYLEILKIQIDFHPLNLKNALNNTMYCTRLSKQKDALGFDLERELGTGLCYEDVKDDNDSEKQYETIDLCLAELVLDIIGKSFLLLTKPNGKMLLNRRYIDQNLQPEVRQLLGYFSYVASGNGEQLTRATPNNVSKEVITSLLGCPGEGDNPEYFRCRPQLGFRKGYVPDGRMLLLMSQSMFFGKPKYRSKKFKGLNTREKGITELKNVKQTQGETEGLLDFDIVSQREPKESDEDNTPSKTNQLAEPNEEVRVIDVKLVKKKKQPKSSGHDNLDSTKKKRASTPVFSEDEGEPSGEDLDNTDGEQEDDDGSATDLSFVVSDSDEISEDEDDNESDTLEKKEWNSKSKKSKKRKREVCEESEDEFYRRHSFLKSRERKRDRSGPGNEGTDKESMTRFSKVNLKEVDSYFSEKMIERDLMGALKKYVEATVDNYLSHTFREMGKRGCFEMNNE